MEARLRAYPRPLYFARTSLLTGNPVFLLRVTSPSVLTRLLIDFAPKLMMAISATTYAISWEGPMDDLFALFNAISATIPADSRDKLLELRHAGTGTVVWTRLTTGRGGGGSAQSDRLIKIVGLPALWGSKEVQGLMKALSTGGKVAGAWTMERLARADGTGLDQCRLTLAHGMSVSALVAMKEMNVKVHKGGVVTIKFDSVSAHFEWPIPPGASWRELSTGIAQAGSDRRGRESE